MDENTVRELLGQKIKSYRNKLNFTQFVLGEKININQRQVALIEAGKSFPSLKTLTAICEVFDCQLKDLFDNNYMQSHADIKKDLLGLIDSLTYKEVQILYLIAKNF